MPKALPTPIADAKSVVDLIRLFMAGRVRVPVYQRDLEWKAEDVLSLFDSIYRGFPIGSLLFHRRYAPAKTFKLGPLEIHAPESSAALDVVDGQQRLVSLAASLMRPTPIPTHPSDPYVVYFDVATESFQRPPQSGECPDTWVPLPFLADGTELVEWAYQWVHGRDAALRRILFDAGTRIREYKVPAYIVEVDDDDADTLREIFRRVNAGGKPLKWPVIHDALYGNKGRGKSPSTLGELGDELAELGMGKLEDQDLLRCLVAFEGRDVTRSLEEHLRQDSAVFEDSAAEALPTLRRSFDFLRGHGRIPHLRLLPRTAPLTILARFFRLHPEPSSRSLELLTRWLWRSFLAIKSFDERTFQRKGVRDIDGDEEQSVQRLLGFLPRHPPEPAMLSPMLPDRFDARAAESRIALLGLASLTPRDLANGRPLDVAALIEREDRRAFRRILNNGADTLSSPANRAFLPGTGIARSELLAHAQTHPADDPVLRSHAISAPAHAALLSDDAQRFLDARAQALLEAIREFTETLTAMERSDRPSIDYLLESAQ